MLGIKCHQGGGKIYLHFLFFKKTIYRDTDLYWKDGFYKVPSEFDFNSGKGRIIISTNGIRLDTGF